ncbi:MULTISPECIES: GntR family transcriptional regulator [unclassified Microbacterium]|uniref:GntR family transcriptional regulator n=1 Tax=unclassified Microbacterium TaxID=2609290 RepID=UPI00097F4776|nr:GntR family transcriptional regulator [Microbacterium sp. JB110]RCS60367.1 GntR family transcriptional regulator [Microbacterium sp. JB110]SJM49161.1 Transcriptional regulator, GntR family [Frigoribacterium sp. JB110]
MQRRPEAAVPQITRMIVDQLLDGSLRRGQKLSTARVAEMTNVSRVPVREALRELSVLGVIDYLPNRGFRVPPLPGTLELEALLDVRDLLEPEAHAYAAERATDEEVAAIVDAFERGTLAESAGEYGQAARLHHRGLRAIVDASHHPELQRVLTPLIIRSALHFPAVRAAADAEGLKGHRSSAQAIADRDPEQARLRAQEHLAFLRRLVETVAPDERPRVRIRRRTLP